MLFEKFDIELLDSTFIIRCSIFKIENLYNASRSLCNSWIVFAQKHGFAYLVIKLEISNVEFKTSNDEVFKNIE